MRNRRKHRNSHGQVLTGLSGLLIVLIACAVGILTLMLYYLAFSINATYQTKLSASMESGIKYGVDSNEWFGKCDFINNSGMCTNIRQAIDAICHRINVPLQSTDVQANNSTVTGTAHAAGLPVIMAGTFGSAAAQTTVTRGMSAVPAVLDLTIYGPPGDSEPKHLLIPTYGHGEIRTTEIGPPCNGIYWWHYNAQFSQTSDPIYLN